MAKLTVDELSVLFEGRTPFVEQLATYADPLGQARTVLRSLPERDVVDALNTHPRIGSRALSAVAAGEQGGEDEPSVLAELTQLNRVYEDKFGFRLVVFVNRRSRAQLLPVLRARLMRPRAEELATAIDELVAIAEDRYRRRSGPSR